MKTSRFFSHCCGRKALASGRNRDPRGQDLRRLSQPGDRRAERPAGRDDIDLLRGPPDGQVGSRIADVRKFAVSVLAAVGLDCRELGGSLQVLAPLGAQSIVEQSQMIGDSPGRHGIAGRGQHDLSAFEPLGLDELQDLIAVGQAGHVGQDQRGNLSLEMGGPRAAREEACARARLLTHDQQQRFPQQIGGDQRTVEIDERDPGHRGRFLRGRRPG